MTPETISSGLVPNPTPSTPYVPPLRTDWDLLFPPLFDELLNPPPSVDQLAPEIHSPLLKYPRGIFLNQSIYALESLKKYGMEFSDPVDTPMVEKSKLDEDTQEEKPTYADADHEGCQDTRLSASGSMQLLEDRLVSWSSKEQVENGVVELYFVNTEYQLADIFTKALGRERIEFLINKLGIMSETLKQLAEEAKE
ncbi:hypothetical protein Tco_0821818 [Tanacetum coccineum]|uniref:Uncharacterized protein n=1 Tax=Tanacetum coccineum TaxID=301880 RepID=A0ABQ5AF48_9ASTR